MTDEILDETVETKDQDAIDEQEEKGWVPWGNVVTFSELDAVRAVEETAEQVRNIMDDFRGLSRNIMYSDDTVDKGNAIKALADEFARRLKMEVKETDKDSGVKGLVQKVIAPIQKAIKGDPPAPELLIWKEADGSYKWVARYSNNFRDDDDPAEIISAKSHQRFEEMVDKGEYPMPELQIWHTPQWRIGDASWVAYDDTGFSLAVGTIDKEFSELAEALMTIPPEKIKMSHGMPYSSIVRDPDDETIIVEHQTKEITILPAWAAANKLTGFVLPTKEEQMIPDDKKAMLNQQWDLGPQILEFVESTNKQDAAKAQEENIESKEASPAEEVSKETTEENVETKGEVEAKAPDTEVSPDVETEETPKADADKVDAKEVEAEETEDAELGEITREEIATGIQKAQEPILEWQAQVNSVLTELVTQLKELSKSDEEKIAKQTKNTPTASIAEMIAMSVIGNPATRVDGRTTEGKAGPKETPPDGVKDGAPMVTGIRHIDHLFQSKEQ